MTEFIKPINTSMEPHTSTSMEPKTDSKKCKKKQFCRIWIWIIGFGSGNLDEDPSKLHRKLKTFKSQKET